MTFRASNRRRPPAPMRLPLIALIDVVLFLLFYFIIAGSLSGVESSLAAAIGTESKGRAGADLAPQVLQVETSPGGIRYRIGDRTMTDRATLVALLKKLPQRTGIVVKVAGDAPVSAAATALQSCKDAGFTKVSYVPTK